MSTTQEPFTRTPEDVPGGGSLSAESGTARAWRPV